MLLLEPVTRKLAAAEVPHKVHVGHEAETIVHLAEEYACTRIVMESRPEGLLSRDRPGGDQQPGQASPDAGHCAERCRPSLLVSGAPRETAAGQPWPPVVVGLYVRIRRHGLRAGACAKCVREAVSCGG